MSFYDLQARFRPIETWPEQPTRHRKVAKFRASWGETLKLLRRELGQLGAKNVVLEIDMPASCIRQDGYPRADARARGPGVILSIESKYGPLRYPCDRYTKWEDNLRAIALSLEALRSVDRHGVTRRGEQYRGWGKLPPAGGTQVTMTAEDAASFVVRAARGAASRVRVIAVMNSRATFQEEYRAAAMVLHPDTGGSHEGFTQLQAAKAILDKHFGISS